MNSIHFFCEEIASQTGFGAAQRQSFKNQRRAVEASGDAFEGDEIFSALFSWTKR
jgi:hypothetical protein